jgi:hypothetical protein
MAGGKAMRCKCKYRTLNRGAFKKKEKENSHEKGNPG